MIMDAGLTRGQQAEKQFEAARKAEGPPARH
jgi:hypothetical protein